MYMGQMLEDIKLSAEGRRPIDFFGTAGGVVPSPDEVKIKMRESLESALEDSAEKPRKPASKKRANA